MSSRRARTRRCPKSLRHWSAIALSGCRLSQNGKVVGIVSRSKLIQALASSKPAADSRRESDRTIRLELLNRLGQQQWTDFGSRNVIVEDGVVHLWGLVGSESERKALIALAQELPGVSDVADEMIPAYW